MSFPTITALPTPPSSSDATNFASRADAFLGALGDFGDELNAFGTAANSAFFPPGLRNRIINGDFRLWQRATSQTADGIGSADRWYFARSGTTQSVSRQAFTLGQTDVPGEPTYFLRNVVSSVAGAGNYCIVRQRIEGVRLFAGQSVRVSFYVKADTTRSVALEFVQSFGTGGSPSADVTAIGAEKITVTSSWQRIERTVAITSISGKTIGSDGNDHLALNIWLDAGSTFNARTGTLGQQSGTFDIANVQVELGTVTSDFERRPLGVELALAQRYYCKTFPLDTVPADSAAVAGALVAGLWTGSTHFAFALWQFPMTMRGTPSLAYYSVLGGTAGYWRNAGNTASSQPSAYATGPRGAVVFMNNGSALSPGGADYYAVHVAADAEL